MAYTMDKNLETGNAMIDEQHQKLFDAINSLLDACSKGKGRAEIGSTLKFLKDYISKHFRDEEDLQRRTGYPDYDNHIQYHHTYEKTVQDMLSEFEQTGATIVLVAKTNTNIAGWLINHIKKEDVKVAAHVKSKQ